MSRLITAKNISRRIGALSVADGIRLMTARLARSGQIPFPWAGLVGGSPVNARIDFGRWIADCPYCGGAEYVDPDEPIFFCCSCGMSNNNGLARPVTFPKNIDEIEALVMDRPVDDGRGGDQISKAFQARPVVPGLGRSWTPNETVADLRAQNRAIKKVK